MDTIVVTDEIKALHEKLDVVVAEIEHQRRHRREMADLKEDLLRVAQDAYQTALVELEDVHDHLRTADVVHLGKKLLRNVNTIASIVEQLESVKDFLEDAAPLVRESVLDGMNTLDRLDRAGYFTFGKEASRILDNIVSSFTAEDVRKLGENVVAILNTVKNLTQPDVLQALNNALAVYKNLNVRPDQELSLLGLVRELNTPEARRGLAVAVAFLKNLADIQPARHEPLPDTISQT